MTSYVETLQQEGAKPSARFHEFRTQCDNKGSVHVFFEGKDDAKFYMHEVRRRASTPIYAYACEGKDNVVSIRAEVARSTYAKSNNCLFLVDKDFDDYLGRPDQGSQWNTYATDSYSIENYLVTEEVMEILLKDFCSCSTTEATYLNSISNFKKAHASFYKRIVPYMALAILLRREKTHVRFKDVSAKSLLRINADGIVVKKKPGFKAFKKAAGLAGKEINILEWRSVIYTLQKDPPKKWVRGKFEREFFEEFLKFITQKMVISSEKLKPLNAVANSMLIETMAPRITLPKSLTAFLNAAFKNK